MYHWVFSSGTIWALERCYQSSGQSGTRFPSSHCSEVTFLLSGNAPLSGLHQEHALSEGQKQNCIIQTLAQFQPGLQFPIYKTTDHRYLN
jgi:hypothetical protein